MVYLVGLIEYGKVTHVWNFGCDYNRAIDQLSKLLSVYDEVNEVEPLILKVGYSEQNIDFRTLLNTRCIVPKV